MSFFRAVLRDYFVDALLLFAIGVSVYWWQSIEHNGTLPILVFLILASIWIFIPCLIIRNLGLVQGNRWCAKRHLVEISFLIPPVGGILYAPSDPIGAQHLGVVTLPFVLLAFWVYLSVVFQVAHVIVVIYGSVRSRRTHQENAKTVPPRESQ